MTQEWTSGESRQLSGFADCLQPKNEWQKAQLARWGRIPQLTYPDPSGDEKYHTPKTERSR